jgi:hypothetical protein
MQHKDCHAIYDKVSANTTKESDPITPAASTINVPSNSFWVRQNTSPNQERFVEICRQTNFFFDKNCLIKYMKLKLIATAIYKQYHCAFHHMQFADMKGGRILIKTIENELRSRQLPVFLCTSGAKKMQSTEVRCPKNPRKTKCG